ncbi:hypothetical protein K2173_016667 [Erythroxylum novogranatense]|uniref:non-specific serine/threonine protein kinase n=1 Tax=Erythroxylum novogranatense TaxID=1862640 RepID=A0AAV8SHH6_9ROSI|nr:hypothetical protein K2173_016667 [Erythroxylum novogranatense]
MHRQQVETQSSREYIETDPTGRYGRFDEVLGKGAMKTVYKAIDEVIGMEVAWNQVKLNQVLCKPEDLQRLYSEVHLLSNLNHESIIRFHTSWIDVYQKTFNFITEMFTSGTLREYRKKYRQVDIRAIKNWSRQILQGLVYLHSHDPPVIHRDLKCDNIFVNGHLGQVKIGDLGLATILKNSKLAHSVIGTPEFMAPELYEEEYNELVDVYSFGMCVLEMLTTEYPYGECTNPAQIYKKVTSGKLPAAYYRIQDLEAQRFIGKCLATASERLSARDLLLDPFLASDDHCLLSATRFTNQTPFLNTGEMEKLHLSNDQPRTEMTITGKLNPDDDTIFLKVQITDKDGSPRNNIYFPFDIIHDTPMNVAMEMVKELEIDDWEPHEIAEMIDGEISALIPNWKKWDLPEDVAYHTLEYQEDEPNNPFHSSSSCSSSQDLPELMTHCLLDDLFDDTSSQSSSHSGSYSNMKYFPGDDHKPNFSSTMRVRNSNTRISNLTRFGPRDNSSSHIGQAIARSAYEHCRLLLESQNRASNPKNKRLMNSHKFQRNRSLVDVRSQLLHQSLVEEVNKRRMFKTVGALEIIGFQELPGGTGKASSHQTWSERN